MLTSASDRARSCTACAFTLSPHTFFTRFSTGLSTAQREIIFRIFSKLLNPLRPLRVTLQWVW